MISLKRYGTNPITMNIIISLIMGAIFGLVFIQIPEINSLLIITIVVIIITLYISLLFLAQRRFLNVIEFSEKDSLLKIESIYGTKKNIKIDQIQTVSLLNSKGLKNETHGFRNRNLSFKIQNNFQPQVFEVENETNHSKGIEIIKKIIEKYGSTTLIYYRNKKLSKQYILEIDKNISPEKTKELEAILNNKNIDFTVKNKNVR